MTKPLLYALSTYIGTVIGVGLFGLPYVAMKSGFIIVILFFIVIGMVLFILQLMYAEICLQTKNREHQLPGHTELFLGKKYKKYASLAFITSTWGALLAYIIIGGNFLFQLFSPWFSGSLLLYQMLFYLLGAFLVYKGLKSVAKTEFFMLFLFLVIIVLLTLLSIPKIKTVNLVTFDINNIFFPYGVVIFSLWGLNIIPTLKEYLKGNTKYLKYILNLGLFLCSITYLIFTLTVLGVTGTHTTPDALTGLATVLSPRILVLGYAFGVLTTFTSFIALGIALKSSFQQDFHLTKELSWFFALFVPLVLFAFGMTNFIAVISISGAVMLALQGIIIGAIYRHLSRQQKKYSLQIKLPGLLVYGTVIILVLGIFSEILFTLRP